MRKSGFFVQRTSNELRDAIFQVRPTVIVSLAHDKDFWQGIRQAIPALLIGRLDEAGRNWRNMSPEEWAQRCGSLGMPYHAWLTWNEPDGINNEVSAKDAKAYDEWCCHFRKEMLRYDYEAVGPNVASGVWHGDAIVKHMPNLCQTFKYISLHEYSARAMWDQNPKLQRRPDQVPKDEGYSIGWWYTLRYRQWWRAICNQYPQRMGQFKIIVGECGVTYAAMEAGWGDIGWMTDMSEEEYLDSLGWYFGEEMNKDSYCAGGAIFMVGVLDGKKWGTFETLPLADRLVGIAEVGDIQPPEQPAPPEESPPEEEPEKPDGGEKMSLEGIKVWKWDDQAGRHIELTTEADKQALIYDKYGAAFRRAEIAPEQKAYRLVELWEKTGHSSLITQVLDENGDPIDQADVAFYWSDAPSPPDPNTPVYPHDWYRNFVHGPTNVNGDVGPGMGRGAYHGEGQGGPHAVWVRDPNIPGDICEKLGMLAGTFHDHLDQKFKLVTAGGGEPPGGDTELAEIGRETKPDTASNMLYICFPDDESLVHDRATFAGIVGSNLDLDTLDWERYTDTSGNKWLRSGVCADWEGDATPRLYWIQAHDLPAVTSPFGPRVSAQFERDAKKHILVYLGYGAPTEEPPPTEPPTDWKEAAQEMAGLLRQMAAVIDSLTEL